MRSADDRDDRVQAMKRARRRRDTWVVTGVALAVSLLILFVLWLNGALVQSTD